MDLRISDYKPLGVPKTRTHICVLHVCLGAYVNVVKCSMLVSSTFQ